MRTRFALPFRITLLLVLVLSITTLSAVRLFTAIAWRSTLASYVPASLVVYIGLSGAIWTLAGLFLLRSFWRGARHARLAFLVGAAAYATWAWADRLFVQVGPRANWGFALAATVVLLAFVAVVVLNPRTQIYFGRESHEPTPEKPTPS
jgi:hypothetical protein